MRTLNARRGRRRARVPGAFAALLTVIVTLVGACGGHAKQTGRPLHRFPALGARLLVLAPHPDDEVLGAAGVIDAAVHRGAEVRVVVATDGEAGPDKSHAGGALARERRDETRHALADLGVGADAVTFLGYADGSLAEAWSERWTARKRSQERQPADAVVDDLRAALRAATPDSIILPMPLDTHPDHAALNRWALLAVLGEFARARESLLVGYLIHSGARWPQDRGEPTRLDPPPPGCAGPLFPWTALAMDESEARRKAALIAEYRSQVAHSRRLFRYAARHEPFTVGQVIRGPRSMSRTRPGLHRSARGITIRVPCGDCVVDAGAGDRLRMRFIRAASVEERLVRLEGGAVTVRGGMPGGPLAPASDVVISTSPRSVRLVLAPEAFRDAPGAVLEVLPRNPDRTAPAWLLMW